MEEQEDAFSVENTEVAEIEAEEINDSEDISVLAQSDGLRLYLREIARIPLLSASDE